MVGPEKNGFASLIFPVRFSGRHLSPPEAIALHRPRGGAGGGRAKIER